MPTDYTLAELEALTGIPARTIRYYIAQGLVPSPGRDGPASRYAESTLQRLRLIARLRDAHLPLAAIRARLAGLGDEAVASLAEAPAAPEPPASDSALEYIRRLLGEPEVAQDAFQAPPMAPPAAAPLLRQQVMPPMPIAWSPPPPSAVPAQAPPPTVPSAPPGSAPPASAPTPSIGERSQWERIAITNDIELHVRRPLTRADNRLVERLIAFARQLQEGLK